MSIIPLASFITGPAYFTNNIYCYFSIFKPKNIAHTKSTDNAQYSLPSLLQKLQSEVIFYIVYSVLNFSFSKQKLYFCFSLPVCHYFQHTDSNTPIQHTIHTVHLQFSNPVTKIWSAELETDCPMRMVSILSKTPPTTYPGTVYIYNILHMC